MNAKIIVNPYANRWRAGDQVDTIRAAFAAVQVEIDVHLTKVAGEATAVAQAAAAEFDVVVAAGGDGTINEVINGLIQAAGDRATIPFGVLPLGTANDLGDTVHLPRDITTAAQIIAAANTRQIDAGRVNEHYFVNNCALGMEPLVTLENTKMKHLSGNLRYAVSLIRALAKLQAWDMKISWDEETYDGPAVLLSICNGPRTGGLFQMAPGARVDDGYFDYVFAPDVPKRTIIAVLPRLLNGSHIHHPKVKFGRAKRITVESDPGTPIHADGELFAESLTHIEYEIMPGKVTLLVPEKKG